MQALILAAGRGSRLGNKSDAIPKCLLEVGRRRMIEHQLETLAEAGVGPVGMVLGYCADEIKEVVGIRAEFIENPRWSSTNSLYSFLLSREWARGPLLILNSDILLHPAIIDRLLAAEGDAFAYDSSSGHGREHMKVRVIDDRLIDMSKELRPEDISGENVGVLRFSAETLEHLYRKAEALTSRGGENCWLGSAVCELARDHQICAVDVAGLPWGEVDFSYDLDRVRKEVWPAIQRDGAPSRPLSGRLGATVLAVLLVLLGYLIARQSPPAVASAWESVDLENLDRVEIEAGESRKTWSEILADDIVRIPVDGPTLLRVESRFLSAPGAPGAPGPSPYVIEVQIDDHLLDWYKEAGTASTTWSRRDWIVGKKERILVDVPGGHHEVRLRLVASRGGRCLLRVRQEDSLETDDD